MQGTLLGPQSQRSFSRKIHFSPKHMRTGRHLQHHRTLHRHFWRWPCWLDVRVQEKAWGAYLQASRNSIGKFIKGTLTSSLPQQLPPSGFPPHPGTLQPQVLFSRGAPRCAHSSKALGAVGRGLFCVMPLVSHFKKTHPTQSMKESFHKGTFVSCCLIWLSDFSEIKDRLPSGHPPLGLGPEFFTSKPRLSSYCLCSPFAPIMC